MKFGFRKRPKMTEDEAILASMDIIEDLALSVFPDDPNKAVKLVQAAFVKTAMDLFEDDGLLDTMLSSTKELYESVLEGRKKDE